MRGNEIGFRRAAREDIPALVVLRQKQLCDEGSAPTADVGEPMAEYFGAAMKDGSFVCWVAVEGECVVATAGAVFYRLPPTFTNPSGHVAYVTNIFTERTHRRRGIATKLLDMVLREIRTRGVATVRLHASEQGKGIYRRAGFTDSEGYMSMRLEGRQSPDKDDADGGEST